MIFTQHYLACLSHASYLVGDESTGRAVVVDPRRDVERLPRRGRATRADDRAGHRDARSCRLPQRSSRAGRTNGCRHLVRRRRRRRVPHRAAARRPAAVAGRRHARDPRHARAHARVDLHRRVRARRRPGPVRRAHRRHAVRRRRRTSGSAGSSGRAISRPTRWRGSSTTRCTTSCCSFRTRRESSRPTARARRAASSSRSETSSTHRRAAPTNYALQPMTRGRVRRGRDRGPARTAAVLRASTRSATASCVRCSTRTHRRCSTSTRSWRAHEAGAVLLDAREPADFAAGHLRGAVNVGLQGRFAEWAGDVLTPDRDIVLVGDPALVARSQDSARHASDTTASSASSTISAAVFADPSGRRSRPAHGSRSSSSPSCAASSRTSSSSTSAIPARPRPARSPARREIPLAALVESLDRARSGGAGRRLLRRRLPLTGRRQRAARRRGFSDVSDLLGGYAAWEGAGPADLDRATPPSASATSRRSARAPRRRCSTRARCCSTSVSTTNGRPSTRPTPC